MKFMAKTEMNTATFRDIALATAQGSLVDSPLAGYQGSWSSFSSVGYYGNYMFLAASLVVLLYGVIKYRQARHGVQGTASWNPKEPLVFA
jgi:hypothetical protein